MVHSHCPYYLPSSPPPPPPPPLLDITALSAAYSGEILRYTSKCRCVRRKQSNVYTMKLIPESTRQATATALLQDLLLIVRPWTFNPTQIPAQLQSAVHIWHGTEDLQVRLPSVACHWRFISGRGGGEFRDCCSSLGGGVQGRLPSVCPLCWTLPTLSLSTHIPLHLQSAIHVARKTCKLNSQILLRRAWKIEQ